jgi:hypothetical protein
MKSLFIPLAITLAVLMQQPSRASAPSPDEMDNWKVHEDRLQTNLENTIPWKTALIKVFVAEPESAVQFIFLTTYKHRLPDSGASEPEELGKHAKELFKTWKSLKRDCAKAKLDPTELAEAIYRFTNSDWAPVSLTKGPGLDKVATPKDYAAWAKAAIAAGKKAKKAGLEPASVWQKQAASYQVSVPGDIAKTSLTAVQPRF